MKEAKNVSVNFKTSYSGKVDRLYESKMLEALAEELTEKFMDSVKDEIYGCLEEFFLFNEEEIHKMYKVEKVDDVTERRLDVDVSLHHINGLMAQFMESCSINVNVAKEAKK